MTPVVQLAGVVDFAPVVAAAAAALERPGGVVLLPTETVYGLVGRAADQAARERIFQLKGRAGAKALGLFTADYRNLAAEGVLLAGLPERLAARYCPGPITIVAPARDGGTVGFRVPDHPFLLALLRQLDGPLVQTSANRSGSPDAADCRDALAMLAGEVDLAVDGGPVAAGLLASTVVDATGDRPHILRQGTLILDRR